MLAFSRGEIRVLVTKPSIAGFGMNWQNCHNVGFVGLSDSWEQYYQAVRRCWRFGQKNKVNVHLVVAETEGAVLKNIQRKEEQASNMMNQIVMHMREHYQHYRNDVRYEAIKKMELPVWMQEGKSK
jgi:SNF2 family DNA or RNA helicase